GLAEVLARIGRGAVKTRAVDTAAPSPMSHEILNSNPYTYLDDAPLEERRARAVALRRTDPDLAAGLGALDLAAITDVRAQAWPDVRDADELHDALLSMVLVPAAEVEAAGWMAFASEPVERGRATWAAGGIPRLTLGPVRREIAPASAADLMRFLFRWQHVRPGTQLPGRDGLLEVIGQLQGLGLPARAWEPQVRPARIARYDPADLDGLCLSGAVAWGRLATDPPPEADEGPRRPKAPTRAAPLAFVLRED